MGAHAHVTLHLLYFLLYFSFYSTEVNVPFIMITSVIITICDYHRLMA